MKRIITAETAIGSVVGEMMALRRGPNSHVEAITQAIVETLSELRIVFDENVKLRAQNAELATARDRMATSILGASHGKESGPWLDEIKQLRAQNAELRAMLERGIKEDSFPYEQARALLAKHKEKP